MTRVETQKPWAVGSLIVGSEWQGQKGGLFSILRGGRTQPRFGALMAERYGRFPALSGVQRQGQGLTLETMFMSDVTRKAYRKLILDALDADDETPFRLTIVDHLLPGIGPQQVKLAFGPWDVYNDGSDWKARGILEQAEGTLGAGWAIAPGEGLDISGSSSLTLTNTDLAGVEAMEVLWKPADANTYASNRYLLDDGTLELFFRASDDVFVLTDGTTTVTSAAQTFAADTLIHVAAVWGATYGLKLTVDGVETTGAANAVSLAATVYVGTDTATSLPERGELVAVRFYDVLSATQIGYLYAEMARLGDDPLGQARHVQAICEQVDDMTQGGARTLDLVGTLRVDGDPRWRSRDGDYWHWDVTGTGDSETVEVDTEAEVYPVLYITPKSAKSSGFAYKDWTSVIWKTDAVTNYSTKLGVLDTAALIKTATTTTTLNGAVTAVATTIALVDASSFPTVGMAYITDAVNGDEQIRWTGKSGNDLTGCVRGIGGTSGVVHSGGETIAVSKMLANGDDLRVYDGANEIDRWIEDVDTATTDVWNVLDFEETQSTTLDGAMLIGDTVTTLDVDTDISGFPEEGILLIDSEAFTYIGKDDTDRQFLNVTRAVKGTSAAGHSDGATVDWIQHDLWIFYGDATLSAPTVDDTIAPAMELDTSDNDTWVYEEFGDNGLARAGRWVSEIINDNPTFYNGDHGAAANPWIEIGIEEDGQGNGRWYLYNICGITNVNFTNGEQRFDTALPGAPYHSLNSSVDGVTYVVEYDIPLPGSHSTWSAWSRNQAVTAGSFYVALERDHTSGGYPYYVEAADCTVSLDTTYTPDATIGSEQANYPLDCTIENEATGVSIRIQATVNVDDVIEVDTDNKTLSNLNEGENLYGALTQVGGVRRDWLALVDGENTLTYAEAGVADVDVDLVWDRRCRE